MIDRREFSVTLQLAIVRRATDASGRIHCESCGVWVKSRKDYEIDHVISEGVRLAADKKRKLTAADGQLLCVAICHKRKTADDAGALARAKRREAADLGLRAPGKASFGRLMTSPKPEPPSSRRSAGTPALLRRGFVPAGDK